MSGPLLLAIILGILLMMVNLSYLEWKNTFWIYLWIFCFRVCIYLLHNEFFSLIKKFRIIQHYVNIRLLFITYCNFGLCCFIYQLNVKLLNLEDLLVYYFVQFLSVGLLFVQLNFLTRHQIQMIKNGLQLILVFYSIQPLF